MRVLVTGASGWIGSAVVPELLGAGHEVVGLARSDGSASALAAAGATVQRGSLDDLGVLQASAADVDGVIHLAFKHEEAFSGDFESAVAADRRAIDSFGEALAGSDRPLVIASGALDVAPGRVATEADGHDVDPGATGALARKANAEATLALSTRGVRASIVRLPPTNHGEGDNGFVPFLVGIARDAGVSGYVGDGTNRWPAVHRLDSARLFRLAVESAPAGTTLHAAAEEGVPARDIAEAIGRGLSLPVASREPEHFGWIGPLFAMDAAASSAATRELLGWQPTQPGLIADLDAGHYFS